MRRLRTIGAAVSVFGIVAAVGHQAPQAQSVPTVADYIVVLEDGANRAAAAAAIRAAGGTIAAESSAIAAFMVNTTNGSFATAMASTPGIVGAARNRAIGSAPEATAPSAARGTVQTETDKRKRLAAAILAWLQSFFPSRATLDPLDADQWGLKMVRSDLARDRQAGRKDVLVGVLNGGLDSTHPDLVQNYDAARSRNFVRDIPFDELGQEVDGPCEFRGCVDPTGYDGEGTGTHLAGVIAAAANGFGLSGVAPKVTLVDVRVAQDSGFVFLQPFVDGLTYAADIGVDVANLGFYLDPWLFNCTSNPADSPEAQAEQRTTIRAVERALKYAHRKGVTLVGMTGNGHTDLGKVEQDTSSPNYPAGSSYPRTIDPTTCAQLPVEGPFVIGVTALGPSGAKADYSNYGLEHTSVAGPGGYFRDGFGTPNFRTNENLILSTAARSVLLAEGSIDADDNVTLEGEAAGVVKYCAGATCAFYSRLQGGQMAAAHVTGVAALIVSQYGKRDGAGWSLAPDKVENVLINTAFESPCPTPRLFTYFNEGRDASFSALCEGSLEQNGFYGYGIADAFSAVTSGARWAR